MKRKQNICLLQSCAHKREMSCAVKKKVTNQTKVLAVNTPTTWHSNLCRLCQGSSPKTNHCPRDTRSGNSNSYFLTVRSIQDSTCQATSTSYRIHSQRGHSLFLLLRNSFDSQKGSASCFGFLTDGDFFQLKSTVKQLKQTAHHFPFLSNSAKRNGQ